MAPTGVDPSLPISGCVVGSFPSHRRRQQHLFSRGPAQEETTTASIPASPYSKSNFSSNCCSPASCLLFSITIPANSSKNRAALSQRPLWIPHPLYFSVPPCPATEAPTSYGPAAWIYCGVNERISHTESVVFAGDYSLLELLREQFSLLSAFLDYDQTQHKKADRHRLFWSRSAEADLRSTHPRNNTPIKERK